MKVLIAILFFSLNSLAQISEIKVPTGLSEKLKSFETSSGVYLADLDRYLVSSDDTTKKDDPWLFLMDRKGNVEENPVVIKGLEKMTDIESISQDESGTLYILGSQGLNKNGKDKVERNLFVKAHRADRIIQALDVIQLRPLLLKALLESSDYILSNMKNQFEQSLDVESHFVLDEKLYIGLKDPQPKGGYALILDLGSIDKIFRTKQISDLKVVVHLPFSGISANADLLSDMLFFPDHLILTTTSENNQGRLWKYEFGTKEMTILEEYDGYRPEGVAYNQVTQELLILFDQGEEASLFKNLVYQ